LLSPKDSEEPPSKRSRHDSNIITPVSHVHEQRLTSILFGQIESPHSNNTVSTNTSSDVSDNDILLKRLLKAMTDKETIDLIYNKFVSM
jgi:hypothetical protein